MRITSRRFWILLGLLIMFDAIVLHSWLFKPVDHIEPQYWDFRIAELKKIEYQRSTPVAATAPSRLSGQSIWLYHYFPGLDVTDTLDDWYRFLPSALDPTDGRGQIL